MCERALYLREYWRERNKTDQPLKYPTWIGSLALLVLAAGLGGDLLAELEDELRDWDGAADPETEEEKAGPVRLASRELTMFLRLDGPRVRVQARFLGLADEEDEGDGPVRWLLSRSSTGTGPDRLTTEARRGWTPPLATADGMALEASRLDWAGGSIWHGVGRGPRRVRHVAAAASRVRISGAARAAGLGRGGRVAVHGPVSAGLRPRLPCRPCAVASPVAGWLEAGWT